MQERKNKQRGVTLISLAVTIIVLIILAGVSINTVIGDNGIITQAQRAAREMANATVASEEQINALIEELNKGFPENPPEEPTEDPFIPQTDGSWNEEKGVNSPELWEGMTAVYWNEAGEEIELTSESTEEEWNQWYDYNGLGDGKNKWANAVTKDSNGNITGYWVWIPRYAYKIESGLFTNTAGTISIKFLQGTSDLDENGETIGRTYSYSGRSMTNYVIHPAFRDGTSNHFMLGEWDEEVSGFWVAKYEAGYQSNTITNNNGTLSTNISNAEDLVVYSNLNYTSYHNTCTTNALGQNLNSANYSSQKLSYPVFLPLTYSYNNICSGDSYVLSQDIDTANNFYGLNASQTDSHMMKNSEWRSSSVFSAK